MRRRRVFFIAVGAILLTRFLAMAGVPRYMAEVVEALQLTEIWLVVAMTVVYIGLGMFLDPLGLMLLTLPVFLPVFDVMNVDLIWIGVLVVKLIEIGLLTPPVGLNAYVIKGSLGDLVPLHTIFRGIGWFVIADVGTLSLLVAFPAITLMLPGLLQ